MDELDRAALVDLVYWYRNGGQRVLELLSEHVAPIARGGRSAIQISNAHFTVTPDITAPAVITVDSNNGMGWQKSIQAVGDVKCLVCDELDYGRPVCERCERAVRYVRELQDESPLRELLNNPALIKLTEVMTEETLGLYVKEAIRNVAGNE